MIQTDIDKYVRGKSEKLVKLFLLIVKSYQVTDPKDWEWQIEDFIRTIVDDFLAEGGG